MASRIGLMASVLLSTATLAQTPPAGAPPQAGAAFTATAAATSTPLLTGTSNDVNGVFKIAVPVPGKARDALLTLKTDGKTLSGSLTNPYQTDQVIALSQTQISGNRFSVHAQIGNVDFNFAGTAGNNQLAMTMISNEVVPLQPGSKIKTAKETGVDGAYLVAVHAPNNSTMDNILFFNTQGNTLNGKMVRVGGVKDSADFFDGKVNGNQVSFYAKNPMSTFRFDGTVSGEILTLTMTITDTRYAVMGQKQ